MGRISEAPDRLSKLVAKLQIYLVGCFGCDLSCLLPFLPCPPNAARHSCDGSGPNRSRLEFGGIGGIIGGERGCGVIPLHYFDITGDSPAFYRVRVDDPKLDRLVKLTNIRRAGAWGWTGLASDDAPLLLRDVGSEEIYALDWQVP